MSEPFKPFSIPYGWSVSQLLAARKPSSKPLFDEKMKIEPVELLNSPRLRTATKPRIKSEPIEQIDILPSTPKSTVTIKTEPQPLHESSSSDSKDDIKPEPLDYRSSTDSPLSSPPSSVASIKTDDKELYFPNPTPSQNSSTSQNKPSLKSTQSAHKPPAFQPKYRRSLSGLNFAFIGDQKPWPKPVIERLIQRYGGLVRNLNRFNKKMPENFGITIIVGDGAQGESIPKLGAREVRVIDQKTFLREIKMKKKEKQINGQLTTLLCDTKMTTTEKQLADQLTNTAVKAEKRAKHDRERLERLLKRQREESDEDLAETINEWGLDMQELRKEAKQLLEEGRKASVTEKRAGTMREEHKKRREAKQRPAAPAIQRSNGILKNRRAVQHPQMCFSRSRTEMEAESGSDEMNGNAKQEENSGSIKNEEIEHKGPS